MACGVNPRRTEAMTRYARQRWQSVAQVLRSPAEGGGSVGADQFVTFLSILLRPCYLSKLINPLQTRRCYDVTTPTPQGTPRLLSGPHALPSKIGLRTRRHCLCWPAYRP